MAFVGPGAEAGVAAAVEFEGNPVDLFAVLEPVMVNVLSQAQRRLDGGVGIEAGGDFVAGEALPGNQGLALLSVEGQCHGPLFQGQGQRRHQRCQPAWRQGDHTGHGQQTRPAKPFSRPTEAPETGQRKQGGEPAGPGEGRIRAPVEDQRQQYQQGYKQGPGVETEVQGPVPCQPEVQRVDDADQGGADHQGGEEDVFRPAGPLQQHERQAEEEGFLVDRLQHEFEHALGHALHGGTGQAPLPEPFGEQEQPAQYQEAGEHCRQPGLAFHQEVTGQTQCKADHRPQVADLVELVGQGLQGGWQGCRSVGVWLFDAL